MDSNRNSSRSLILYAVAAGLASAAAWWLGTGLHPYWYLTWFAPLPILFLAPRVGRWTAALAALLAFAAGSLNVAAYYHTVAPIPVVALSVVGPAVLFAWFVLIFRRFAMRGQLMRAALSLPALWVAYEYLSETVSPHSTFGNFAYTQMDNLPIIQLASVTGIWSISFLLFLFPAVIAAVAAPLAPSGRKATVGIAALVIFATAILFGEMRLHSAGQGDSVTVGLVDSDPPHTRYQKGAGAIEVVRGYVGQISTLAVQGAQVVVIPEKISGLEDSNIGEIDRLLDGAAQEHRVTVVVGFQHLPNLNESRVYSPRGGAVEATYEKHHMLPAFESDLLPGTTRTLLDRPSGKWGLTICKDMDFPKLSRQYGNDGAALLLVPAWDFTEDGWLHGRMAILRGVESGFAIARSAKMGILTVSDNRGRVLAEKTTGAAGFDTLVATVPVRAERTVYDRFGDWFAWADLGLVVLIFLWPRGR